jgi:predicted membrane protein
MKLFRLAMFTTFTGTMAETILTMYLFGSLWDRWVLAFKITTPMLHALFMSCQLWGTWNFYKMYQKQKYLLNKKEGKIDDVEQRAPIEQELEGLPSLSVTAVGDSLHSVSREVSREPSRDSSQVELLFPSRKAF